MSRSEKKILLATDGSEDAKLASHVATDLAKRTGARLCVAHAWRPCRSGYATAAGFRHLFEREGRRVLEASVDEIEELGGIVVEPRLLRGTPIDAILDLAEELRPALTVLGSRGTGTLGNIPLGSVSEGVVHNATSPVIVARGGEGAWPPEGVTVGDDGSDAAEAAAGLAASIGALFGVEVVLVRAYRCPPQPIGGWSAEDRRRLDEAQAREASALEKRAMRLGQALGGGVTTRVVAEEPAAAILGAGAGRGVLLAVGGRGLDTAARARFGSVSSKVARAALGPVLIYPQVDHAPTRPRAEKTAPVARRPGVPS